MKFSLVPLLRMKNKKWLLLMIVFFPSVFCLILETSTINSKKLPFYGPKSFNGHDTDYYSIGTIQLPTVTNAEIKSKVFDTINFPIIAITFIRERYANESYRLEGLLDYTMHKREDIDKIPFLIVYPRVIDTLNTPPFNLRDSLGIKLDNIEQCFWNIKSYDSLNVTFFKEKPIYIDYSFIVLLDKKRNIRGFYDGRYSAELKRLLAEYKHLRLKEEKKLLIKENEIKNESSH